MQQITIKIDGMMCGMCESHINDAMRNKFAVKKVTSSRTKGETVIVTETDIADEALCAAVNAAGYTPGEITRAVYEKKGLFSFFKK